MTSKYFEDINPQNRVLGRLDGNFLEMLAAAKQHAAYKSRKIDVISLS